MLLNEPSHQRSPAFVSKALQAVELVVVATMHLGDADRLTSSEARALFVSYRGFSGRFAGSRSGLASHLTLGNQEQLWGQLTPEDFDPRLTRRKRSQTSLMH